MIAKTLSIFVVLFFVIATFVHLCGLEGYSEGDRFGVINKFSHKGVVCKSWEGELMLGGSRAGADGNAVPNVWEFSVKPEDESKVVASLQKAAESGQRVKLHYHQAYIQPACQTSTDYFIKSVDFQ